MRGKGFQYYTGLSEIKPLYQAFFFPNTAFLSGVADGGLHAFSCRMHHCTGDSTYLYFRGRGKLTLRQRGDVEESIDGIIAAVVHHRRRPRRQGST